MTTSPPDNAPLLELEKVDVRFGRLRAVENVSFSLHGGEFLGLLGANGAGKTTLMRAISGLQPIRDGDIRVMGETLTDRSQHLLRHLGFTPDTPPLYDGLTVRQFLRFIGKQYGLDAADTDDRIAHWLDQLWLADKADAKIKGLSRGMRQRIGIARTLLPNPALVVLDEPAAGLDPTGRVQFRNLLGDLRRQGKAVIVSSHVLSDLADQCTHIGLMTGGRMERFEPIGKFLGEQAPGTCRYNVRFARPLKPTPEQLAGLPTVVDGALTDSGLLLTGDSDPAAAATLLNELIRRGLPVCAFGPQAVNLEEAYIRASGNRTTDA